MNARGGGKLQLLIALVITAAIILAAVRIIPVYVRHYEFEDAMRTQAKFATVDRKPAQVIQEELFRKAKEIGLPLANRSQIRVIPQSGGVSISVHYTVQVDLIVFKPNLNMSYTTDTGSAY